MTSAVLPLVVDDFAVVRKLAWHVKRNVAAQLGDIAYRCDDGVGERRCVRMDFDVQRHPVDALGVVDHQPTTNDFRMA